MWHRLWHHLQVQIRFYVLSMVVAALCWNSVASAQAKDDRTFKVGGLLFGDVYDVASHHSDEGDGAIGLVLRRGYLTFDGKFSEQWFGRLRFELNQSGEFETYDFEADFKDLYVGWNIGRHRLLFGLSPTPTFDLIESIWGCRYLARTPLDLQGVPSRDTGISASGPLNASGTLKYRAMAGAGVNFGNESGDGEKWMGAISWSPVPRWTFDFYLDFEELGGQTDHSTIQMFAAYQTEVLRLGFLYSNQDRQDDPKLELASAFAVRKLGTETSLIGRVDRLMEPSPRGNDIAYLPFSPDARATFFLGAVEFRLTPKFVMTPNVVVTTYDRNDEGIRPKNDVYLRLTFFLNLE